MTDTAQPAGNVEPLPAAAARPEQQERDLITVAKGGGVSFAGTAVTRIVNYLYSMVLVWGLGGESFGQYTLALAIVNFIGVVGELGLGLSVVRFGVIDEAWEAGGVHRVSLTAILISMPTSLVFLALLYWGAAGIAEGIFHKPELTALLRILAWAVPFIALQSILAAAIRARKAIKYTATAGAVQAIAAFVLAILFMALGWGLRGVAVSFLLSNLMGAALCVIFYLRVVPRPGRVELYPVGQMLKFSVPLTLTKWIQFANERTEILFLGLLPSAIYAGIYKIAWSLAGLETMLRLSMEDILGPFTSDLTHRRQIAQLGSLYKTTAKWSFTWALLLASAYLVFGATLMKFFDPSYEAGAIVLVALAFAQLYNEATGACGTILIMSGRSDLSLLNTVVLFASSFTLDWILIPRYGLGGAAFVGVLAIVLVNTMRVVEVWALLDIHPFSWSFLKPAAAGLVAVGATMAVRTWMYADSLLTHAMDAVIFACIYLATIIVLQFDAQDMVVLNAVQRKFERFIPALEDTR